MFKTKKDVKIAEQKSKIENQDKYIKDLKSRIRLKENSNNYLRTENAKLEYTNKKFKSYEEAVENVLYGKRTPEQKIEQIIELTRDLNQSKS